MSGASHAVKAVDLAGKITSMVEQALRPIEVTIHGWPAEFRAIMWEAVVEIAQRRASAARQQ